MLPAPSSPSVIDEAAIGARAYRNLAAYSPGCVVAIPPHLAENLRAWHGAEGERWLAELPARVAAIERSWRLRVAEPFAGDGAVSWVAPAVTGRGGRLVLKLFLPDRENALEGEALRHYDGRGAVRCLRAEPGVLLLERALPGDSLWTVPDDAEAVTVAAALLEQLWRPAASEHPFRTLEADAGGWSESIMRHWQQLEGPCEVELAELAARLAQELSASQGEQVLLHQDLHGGNILRSQRRPWLAIDPKPLVGEREFDLASLIRDRRWQIDQATVRARLDLLARLLPVDRERMRGWAIVHALEWGMDATGADRTMLDCARWLSRM
jgi:streptomycin 6-kinase